MQFKVSASKAAPSCGKDIDEGAKVKKELLAQNNQLCMSRGKIGSGLEQNAANDNKCVKAGG